MAKWNIIILLYFSLSSSTDISLSIDSYLLSSLFVTLYLFPLLPAQESYSRSLLRKLPPISPPHFPVLVADLASPRRWSRHLILHNSPPISPPHAPISIDLVDFGFWFGLRLWVVSQATSMGWVEVAGCGFDGLIQVIWVEVVGCSQIMDRVWDWVLIWIEVQGWASMTWFRWEVSHGDCVVFVVVVERWKRKVGGGWIEGFFFFTVVGGCQLRSGKRGRLLGPRLCFFFFFFLLS